MKKLDVIIDVVNLISIVAFVAAYFLIPEDLATLIFLGVLSLI